MCFTHLHVHSPYSLLDGGSSIEKLVETAARHGMTALALTDHDSLAAAVKFASLCRAYRIKPILGIELTLDDGSHLTLLARNRNGYSHLCRLLSLGFEEGGRLTPRASIRHLMEGVQDVICLSGCRKGRLWQHVLHHRQEAARQLALDLREWFGPDNFYIEIQRDFTPDSHRVTCELAALADELGIPTVATNNVHYAGAEDAVAHEILRCIATGTTVETAHPDRPLNDERRLKSREEMTDLFRWRPEAIENTARIAETCEDSLPFGDEVTPAYKLPDKFDCASDYLRHLAYKGAKARYNTITTQVRERLDDELTIISALGYDDYFLMVWKVVQWARKQGIRCTGRGSAADSCVAYSLFLTDVDVLVSDLPFARFLTEGKMPDIDIDFDSARRDEVFVHIKQTYGEDNVAMVCTYATFRAKSAVRDVGKALGLPADVLSWFTNNFSHFMHADGIEACFDKQAEFRQYAHLKERFQLLFRLCAKIANFPRHIATHSSGIVISKTPLNTLSPLQGTAKGLVRIIQLDKDDAEEAGLIKFDVLGLRILSAFSDSEEDIRRTDGWFDTRRIPFDDEETYRMIRAGAAVGTFQFESAAQRALATRLSITRLEDLTAAVALIRPGPVKGNAVSRFVAARNGWDDVHYPHPCLAPILRRTYGVIIFQEQVIGVVAEMMGCAEAEADRFRKRLNKHHREGTMDRAREEFVGRSVLHHPDFSEKAANLLFDQIQSWFGYGFTEGHAHSFALTGYRSAYLSVHYPAEYFASLMSNQPMGYFDNNSLAAEARRRGVRVYGVDINASRVKCQAEETDAIRLGLCLVFGLREEDVETIERERERGAYTGLLDFCVRVPLHVQRVENLILSGAFDALHAHRRGLLFRLDETLGLALVLRSQAEETGQARLDYGVHSGAETPVAWDVEDLSPWDKTLWEWQMTGVTAQTHALSYLRESLARKGVMTTYEAIRQRQGTRVTAAGINVRPHRPPTKSGEPILFTSIEDETGFLEATVVGDAIVDTTETFLTSSLVLVRGTIQRVGRGAYLKVERAKPLRMTDFLAVKRETGESGESPAGLAALPPAAHTYPGTRLLATV